MVSDLLHRGEQPRADTAPTEGGADAHLAHVGIRGRVESQGREPDCLTLDDRHQGPSPPRILAVGWRAWQSFRDLLTCLKRPHLNSNDRFARNVHIRRITGQDKQRQGFGGYSGRYQHNFVALVPGILLSLILPVRRLVRSRPGRKILGFFMAGRVGAEGRRRYADPPDEVLVVLLRLLRHRQPLAGPRSPAGSGRLDPRSCCGRHWVRTSDLSRVSKVDLHRVLELRRSRCVRGRLQHRRASRCTGSHLGWTGDRPRLDRCYGHRHGGAASLTRSVTRFVNLWCLYRTEWRAGISMSFAGDGITVTIAAGVGLRTGSMESNGTTNCIRFHDISSVDHPATHPARFRS